MLENCGKDAVEIARCFVSQKEGFSIYSDYCTNYPKYVNFIPTIFLLPKIADREFVVGQLRYLLDCFTEFTEATGAPYDTDTGDMTYGQ